MKVLVVTNQLIKEENGRYFCIENVLDILKRFATLGELSICACKYSGKSSNVLESSLAEVVAPENIHFVNKNLVKTDSASRKVIEKCVESVDLVVGYLPSSNGAAARCIAHKHGKKFLAYVVGCPWDSLWNHGLMGKVVAPIKFFTTRHCIKKSDFSLYVTEHFLQKRYPCLGLTCGCSDVKIPELEESVLENRLQRLAKLNSSSQIELVTIANYSVRYKGQHFVIQALANLKKQGYCNFHYHLIGGGDKSWLENLAKKLGVSDLVQFEGMVPHSQIFKYLDKMHVYLQPSLQEGLPRSVVEAMSRGLLCICANTAAMPEMVEPEYVVERKSVEDIERALQKVTAGVLKKQAVRNFNEAKQYTESVLDKKRNEFFAKIKFCCEASFR